MGLTTAMFNALSGLNAHSRKLEVIGNNISNVNTTAFKGSRLMFESQFARTFAIGTAPGATTGGTNPGQVGLGVSVSGTQRNFQGGSLGITGINTDLAIEGNGMFVVDRGGTPLYTRAGGFQLNEANELVTARGERLQGYGVDASLRVVPGALQTIRVPVGDLTIAEATSAVRLSGNLNADGEVGGNGSLLLFSPLEAGGAPITATTALSAIDGVPDAPFADGDTITVEGASRGGKTVPAASFPVTADATVEDFLGFLTSLLGIVPDGGDPDAPESGGFEVDADGQIALRGNIGQSNELSLNAENIRLSDIDGVTKPNQPFEVTRTEDATGESVRHTFVVYDSLGTVRTVDVTMVLAARDSGGTYWRAFAHSDDDAGEALNIEMAGADGVFGTDVPLIHFDNFGELVEPGSLGISLDLSGTGAASPLQFEMSLSSESGRVTAFSNVSGVSELAATDRDGVPFGVLESFGVGGDGVVVGAFSNGLSRELGQVVLATFANVEGLVDAGGGLFSVGPNSGEAVIAQPGGFGTGSVVGGGLELSNVDLGREFIDMILTQTGYSASTRVISTSDQLLQQLISIVR
ncbi:MAG: flagellar hook protein FlgE [Phycisphaerales bacterium]